VSILPQEQRDALQLTMDQEASAFRRSFVEAGGFFAIVRFFATREPSTDVDRGRTRRGNAVALRILKACLLGNADGSFSVMEDVSPDELGCRLLDSLSDYEGLLNSLMSMVIDDPGISSSTITDVLRFLRLLLQSPVAAQAFVSLPHGMAERFLAVLLMHDEGPDNTRSSAVSAALIVRRSTHDLILQTGILADTALPWLVKALGKIDPGSESTREYFAVLENLVCQGQGTARAGSGLDDLGTMVCKKLASCPRPSSESESLDFPTGVLCGCLRIVRALIEHGEPNSLDSGSDILLTATGVVRWSQAYVSLGDSMLDPSVASRDARLIDLMGCVFDGFLTPNGASSVSICCDKESRCRGFEVVSAAARSCRTKDGFAALVPRVSKLIDAAAPNLRHRWGQFGGARSEHNPRSRVASKYSGLRNQGCTCYMNSVLQQLFMMPELRDSMCSAPLPSRLRTSGGAMTKGLDIVGKKITLQWENGVSYDAIVEGYEETTGVHRIRYCTTQVAAQGRFHVDLDEIARLPPQLPDEFVLSEGRPGKETGVFEISKGTVESPVHGAATEGTSKVEETEETQDEAASRHLLEEVQKTFIHLDEGSRGRCFDPRALVEACACLKLEFDVWQQNDASEFTTKLLDRLEIALKKYAPGHFQFLDHTFGIKVTKQKICKECGLKSNREEKHINIDCQIRGKTDILEALAAMTEDEIMEGSNRVFCDKCKENTDTVLRTAISTLPNVLILSLKRFDLDFNTFETVKLNSRCSFGEKLNLKPFTLEGLEAMESARSLSAGDPMETDDENEHPSAETHPLDALPNEDYEYKLVGVLVHAGVAQGGHYYSFIKERYPGGDAKWYRFDDEDVTPFDPVCIETECFGGKVKKETKWPNGTVHTVEQEQFANALILFYEKIKPSDLPMDGPEQKDSISMAEAGEPELTTTGYGVFKADVQRSNSTHKWQMFLFDSEFQEFMKRILRLSFEPSEHLDASLDTSWRQDVVQMMLSFVFDVLLYSSDRSSLGDWTRMLRESLLLDSSCGRSAVHLLAQKTRQVSSNWIRTFLLDCPDPGSRSAAACVFGAAIESCLCCELELRALDEWRAAWEEQVKAMSVSSPAPCGLGEQWSALEDITKLNGEGATGVGVVLSFLNVLLESMPRCSRFSSELNGFIRDLSGIRLAKSNCELTVRQAIRASLIPARLVALAARDSLYPSNFRILFPGSSVSHEAAATQMRHETIHNLVSMAGNQLHNSDAATSRVAIHCDYGSLFEALAQVAGLPGCTQAPLIHDTGEVIRNRRRYALNEASIAALTEVFEEYCSHGAPGMGYSDIQRYLKNTEVDLNQFPPQRIQDILNKYSSPNTVPGVATSRCLSLEGFLAYYRDIIQSNDGRLRHDLTLLGFRNDLSRRSHSARVRSGDDGPLCVELHESVALDVAETLGDLPASWGDIANTCLSNSANVFALASNVSEQLALYLVAGAAYRKPAEDLIDRILQAIYQTNNDWAGSGPLGNATLALQVIVHLPDPDRERRIGRIMESSASVARNVDHGGVGILPVLRYLYHARHASQSNRNDLQWNYMRYVEIFKKLRLSQPVFLWLNANRDAWHQLERDLIDSSSHQLYRHQQYQPPTMQQQSHLVRGGNEIVRDGGMGGGQRVSVPLDHGQSDSDLNGMNDSEDDEDSQYEELGDHMSVSANEGPHQIVVTGAGNQAVNGIYRQDGYFQDACKYVMEGRWNGTQNRFYIFCCNVSNNTKHWYISIVPVGSQPGTSNDIDFYTAPVHERSRTVPPRDGWTKAQHGEDGVPALDYRVRPEDVGIVSSQIHLVGDRVSLGNGNGGAGTGAGGGGFMSGDEEDDDDQNERYYEELRPQSPVVQGHAQHDQEDQSTRINDENPDGPSRIV
jgi:ubiquitin carboxyl-terminal hydrolase 9/24